MQGGSAGTRKLELCDVSRTRQLLINYSYHKIDSDSIGGYSVRSIYRIEMHYAALDDSKEPRVRVQDDECTAYRNLIRACRSRTLNLELQISTRSIVIYIHLPPRDNNL